MMDNNRDDFFAAIARREDHATDASLYQPQSPALAHHRLMQDESPLRGPDYHTLDNSEKVVDALDALRNRMRPFLANHAPAMPSFRRVLPIENFDWRIETKADQNDFVGQVLEGGGIWQRVSIPHYGAPQGKATTFYRATVVFSKSDLALGTTFLCFKGVDYKAQVCLNGAHVGSNEGFFAPFEFDATKWAREGDNTLLVRVDNDAINMSNRSWGHPDWEGEKLYGATGPGWDDPHEGWCHCPPGMGIYQDVRVEHRPLLFFSDVYVRPKPGECEIEIWLEVYSTVATRQNVEIDYVIHGRNFDQKEVVHGRHSPSVRHIPGRGDMVKPGDHEIRRLGCGPGVNYFQITQALPDARTWTLDEPWLYQLQLTLLDDAGGAIDTAEQHFGMRSFHTDENSAPRGRLFFNNKEIRLRGTNTMGHLQQCVIKKDWAQLIDDILLAKLCNLNFFRMTQRPVQPEIYDHFDMLGILSQSDFPLFGCLRRSQFQEGLRQIGEMERLLRSHPSCVIVSYMNEPFPNGNSDPHRNLDFGEQRLWYDMADRIVRQANPDRVIKPVDGDYDPPSPGICDRHCYNLWYGNHGIDFGRFHRGYWQLSKQGWAHGCGEFGVEGLDSREVMEAHYPKEWMSARDAEGHWLPDRIPYNQTYKFHHLWYETPRGGIDPWVEKSHAFQRMALRRLGEAFRRDPLCVTCAVHLFIDAFPSNWMKTIIDFHRKPKGGYFGIREAFAPMAVSLRTDRFSAYAGEHVEVEAWLANDTNACPADHHLHYQVEDEAGNLLVSGGGQAVILPCQPNYQGDVSFRIPSDILGRTSFRVSLTLIDEAGKAVHQCQEELIAFPIPGTSNVPVHSISRKHDGEAAGVLRFLGSPIVNDLAAARVILADDMDAFTARQEEILNVVHAGGLLVLLSPPPGTHEIAGISVEVVPAGMSDRHMISRDTDHEMVMAFRENDLRFWHDESQGYITPFCRSCIIPQDRIRPILTTGTGTSGFGAPEEWTSVLAAGEISHGKGIIRIFQLDLANRVRTNSTAGTLAAALLDCPPEPAACFSQTAASEMADPTVSPNFTTIRQIFSIESDSHPVDFGL